MGKQKQIKDYLPVTESTYFILLALEEPMHGYALMQKVTEMSDGVVNLGPGTLYGAFSALQKEELIRKVGEEGRRKTYELTERGAQVLLAHIERLRLMLREGNRYSQKLENAGEN
jgi:DNA-binding PadR family transcriptional regulator